jgi:uncharacterized protein YejL (UPF0352 family)
MSSNNNSSIDQSVEYYAYHEAEEEIIAILRKHKFNVSLAKMLMDTIKTDIETRARIVE